VLLFDVMQKLKQTNHLQQSQHIHVSG